MIRYTETAEYECDKCSHVWRSKLETTPTICPKCKRSNWHTGTTEKPQKLTTLETVQAMTPTERMHLFNQFELCCGQLAGACTCQVEVIEIPAPQITPVQGERLSIDQLKALIAPIESGEVIAQSAPVPVVEDWRFTKDNPQYDDNGRVYRQQYLAPLGKRRRSVEVDADDLEQIIER